MSAKRLNELVRSYINSQACIAPIPLSEEEQRALFAADSEFSENDAFELLCAEGIDEIKWSKSLNYDYMQWIYFNIK